VYIIFIVHAAFVRIKLMMMMMNVRRTMKHAACFDVGVRACLSPHCLSIAIDDNAAAAAAPTNNLFIGVKPRRIEVGRAL